MRVRFLKPFDGLSGNEEIDVDLRGPIQVKELLGAIAKSVHPFESCLHKERDEVLNFSVVLLRGDEILKLTDWVQENDTITVLPPISGG